MTQVSEFQVYSVVLRVGSLRVPRSALSQARPEFTYGKAVLTDAWLAASVSFIMYVFKFSVFRTTSTIYRYIL